MQNSISEIIKECFWNDYKIDEKTIEKNIKDNDVSFNKFLVYKILSNSSFPSARLKSLYSKEQIKEYLPTNVIDKRISERIKLVLSVLFREPKEGVRPWKV
ncbi:MAG TPA: hypothetical protein PLG34_09875 [Spirochaetota bacterium]|jgi:uncharacterized protein (DUF1810 family)|nr:MAG: hypothetical protein BWX91_02093 [Spirochaetes bacterium ADurb.Bin133]HNZ27040.1 hypothetical protein [Spirochaetota bacterium]HPY88278.1 hypothetical protein [Spirochaetota bacterium]HQB61276.1 hypothetical protein [Spirochaetota bacterium]